MTARGDFWSRRKAKVMEEKEADLRAAEKAKVEAQEAALAEKSDEDILAELNLPDPDSLAEGDDVRAFMEKAVPDRIRRRALRALWRTNPVLANVDGLVDYGEDFTDSATVIENLQTAYQVGKGMLAHVEEMARQAELEAEEPTLEDAPAEVGDEAEDLIALTEEEPEEPVEAAPATLIPFAGDEEETTSLPPRRRMQFSFEDHAGGSA